MFVESERYGKMLIAAQEDARKAATKAVKEQYDAALKNANDEKAKAERERDAAKRDKTLADKLRAIGERQRNDCAFTPEDIKDINEAGH